MTALLIAEFRRGNLGYEGGIDNPMSWDRVVEKFHWLSEQFADASLRKELIHAVQELDAKPLSALLDDFVDRLAQRIASFDKEAITDTKRLVDIASLPPDSEIAPEGEAFMKSLARPATQERIKKLMAQGFHRPGDVENQLGEYLGRLGR
jgi:hypothetical protein